MSQLLYTVKEVFSDEEYLKDHGKEYYNIPLYQRGYKWEEKHVTKLLDDIDNFQIGDKKFYCLQNITIVPQDNFFNIVDGQQRLTTLTILLAYLQEKKLVNDKIRFPNNSIRKETNRFLNEVITKEGKTFPEADWEEFIKNSGSFDHQDIYHIFHIHKAIEDWFETKENHLSFSQSKFKSKLLESVKLIINQIDDSTKSEEKIFGNLNSKRVPLDGADLVRAMLITRVAHEEGKREADIKNIVRVNERRVKIGWELDQINNWWSQDKIKNYFTRFFGITSENIGVGKKLFDEEKYPINILYLLFAEKRKEEKLSLELVEKHNNDALGLYKELIKLHSTLQDWYQDRQIYHLLGFLFAHKTKKDFNFGKLWALWSSSVTRRDFIKKLKEKIKDNFLVDGEIIDFNDQDTNWYEEEPTKLVQALVLMDIIHSIKENQSFLPASAFTKASNDIEHIFPQNPQKVEDKKAYITFLNQHGGCKINSV
ncbi:hypothetical protein C7S20_18325 [Christiangramia fulva]|uniref:GmrSD restriction endonucleases N-terminal domain-containing protein n=1 Tax=Christiangramia fulva TaxID=2126553 RepID=A0A2R3Z9S4_9FLAO|nr:DUF262 domain-containing protein [Christiangramia fulva]AVR47045.1 hypothetical protein C7S20_18325 [Christiangramia fulva]